MLSILFIGYVFIQLYHITVLIYILYINCLKRGVGIAYCNKYTQMCDVQFNSAELLVYTYALACVFSYSTLTILSLCTCFY